jgi:hypothetical protein
MHFIHSIYWLFWLGNTVHKIAYPCEHVADQELWLCTAVHQQGTVAPHSTATQEKIKTQNWSPVSDKCISLCHHLKWEIPKFIVYIMRYLQTFKRRHCLGHIIKETSQIQKKYCLISLIYRWFKIQKVEYTERRLVVTSGRERKVGRCKSRGINLKLFVE